MHTFVLILRILLFLLSIMGYALYLQARHSIPYGFGLAIGAGFVISVLWLVGMLFPITAAVWCLWACGLLLLGLNFRKVSQPFMNATNLFLFLSAALAFALLRGHRLTFVDDFNHWGTMARSVLEHGALPGAGDPLITFVSYPPGAALWIAGFLMLSGSVTEDMYLFGQALLALLFVCPLTVRLRDGRKMRLMQGVLLAAVLLLAASMLSFASTMKSLCVDGLLAAAAVGLMAFVLNCKGSVEKRILFSLPLLIAVISIKDSGRLFAVFAAVLLLFSAFRSGRGRRRLLLAAAPLTVILGMELLWRGHVYVSFPQAASAPHAQNLSRWEVVFHSRSPEDLETIADLFIGEVFHVRTVLPLLLFMAVLLGAYWLRCLSGDAKRRETLLLTALLLGHYLAYLLGLAFVYFFSMEIEGALRLQSYTRYLGTEVCFVFGVCLGHLAELVFGAEELPEVRGRFAAVASRFRRQLYVLASVGMIAALAWFYCGNFSFENAYIGSARERVLTLSGGDYTGDAAVYITEEEEWWLDKSQVMYDFRSPDITVVVGGDEEALYAALNAHSHLLIYDVDETLTECLGSRGWQEEPLPGFYALENGQLRS